MKRSVFVTLLLLLSLTLTVTFPAYANITLKLAVVTPPHHAYALGAKEFARLVKNGTGGEVIIKVYAGGQLGKGERELLEGLQLGTIHLAVTATGPVSILVPAWVWLICLSSSPARNMWTKSWMVMWAGSFWMTLNQPVSRASPSLKTASETSPTPGGDSGNPGILEGSNSGQWKTPSIWPRSANWGLRQCP